MKGFSGIWGALLVAVALTAGCSGGGDGAGVDAGTTQSCTVTGCGASEDCNAATGKCELASACKGVTCDAGKGCDKTSGICKNLCTAVANPPTCTAPQVCNPTTGTCADLCAGVTCSAATEACNPASGKCEAKCKPTTCSAEESCEPTTGACSKKCETETKPAGKPECAAGLKCKATTGECVTKCQDKVCPYAQWCDEATGACTGGQPPAGYVGSACTGADDCTVPGRAVGQESRCFGAEEDFPNGYCTAQCSATVACPQGAFCLQNSICVDQCTKDADCRNAPEYHCLPLGEGQYGCFPAPQCTQANAADCSPVGGDCATDEDCKSGSRCLPEMDDVTNAQGQPTGQKEYSGWDGGYCTWLKRATDSCPAGSVGVKASSTDSNFELCLKTCQLSDATGAGLNYAVPGACGLGEACIQLQQNSTEGVCVPPSVFGIPSCVNDNDCQTATCTATDKQDCGNNQPCTNGTCRRADKCTTNADCAQGTVCGSNGECFNNFCEPSIGQCVPDCTVVDTAGDTTGACAGVSCAAGSVCSNAAGGTCVVTICPTGTTCNAATKRCDRACTRDAQCGTNAVCEDGLCTAACTIHNEATVCGSTEVCGAGGHCVPKCSSDGQCGANEYCAASGRCTANCVANAAACTSAQVCDAVVGSANYGRCISKCTAVNELTVCGTDKFCQLSTGLCRADCLDVDAAVSDESAGTNCAEGGKKITVTRAGAANSTYLCNSRTAASVTVADEPAGVACAEGGKAITVVENNALEVTYACAPAAGSIVEVTVNDVPAGADCASGGKQIVTVIDSGTPSFDYACDTVQTASASVSDEAPGLACENGGKAILAVPAGGLPETTYACRTPNDAACGGATCDVQTASTGAVGVCR